MITPLHTWHSRYQAAGLATIPLAAGSKRPIAEAWQRVAPVQQWQDAGPRFSGNIGILAGNGCAIIDCDSRDTVEAVKSGLDGLGIAPPVVYTPSGGQHFYIQLQDVPKAFNWSRLAVGPGELRARNSFVVAPSSSVEGIRYRWNENAGPEMVERQPVIAWRDLQFLVAKEPVKALTLECPPVRLLWRDMPVKASELLGRLRTASKGEGFAGYASRSEAEAAVVAHLILSGWSFDEIASKFAEALPGHYRSYRTAPARARYLHRTYSAVLNELASNPERYELANWYQAAALGDWPGNGGYTDRAVYLALVAIGWQASSYTPYASHRSIVEHTAIGRLSVIGTSINRLQAQGLVRRLQTTTAANSFEVMPFYSQSQTNGINTVTFVSRIDTPPSYVSELWKPSALGRTAGALYELLDGGSWSANGLTRASGKRYNTIRRGLACLERYGLAEHTPDGWKRGTASVVAVADLFECRVAAERRRYRHELDREAFSEYLKVRETAQNTASGARNGKRVQVNV